MFNPLPPLEKLNSLYIYNSDTGVLLSRRRNKPISTVDKGYLRVQFGGVSYYAHRIAYFMGTRENPGEDVVDHIDRNPLNNRLENLRRATRQLNRENSKLNADNSSGYRGVYKYKNRYQAQLRRDGKMIYLGSYKTAEEAAEAVKRFHTT